MNSISLLSDSLPVVSIGSAGLLLDGLTCLVLIAWMRRQAKASAAVKWLFGALLVEALWAFGLAAMPVMSSLAWSFSILESVRACIWGCFVLALLTGSDKTGQPDRPAGVSELVGKLRVVLTGLLLLAILLDALPIRLDILLGVHLLMAIVVLVGLEQIWRNTVPVQRWGIRFMCVAMLFKFAFDAIFFGYSMMVQQIDPSVVQARGFINFMLMPLIAVSAARVPSLKLNVQLSRTVVFHTTALLLSSVALLMLAASGYWIRYFGGTWGSLASMVLNAAAAIVLVLLIGSGAARAKLRVLIAKHLYSYRYDYRVEWLKMTAALSGNGAAKPQELPSRVLEAIAGLVESSGGALWLPDTTGVFRCAASSGDVAAHSAIDPDDPIVSFVRERRWIIDLPQCRADPASHAGLQLPLWLRSDPNAWLVVPLQLHHDLAGLVLLKRPRTAFPIDWEVRDLLKTAGQQAASYLLMNRNIEAVAEARQFESFNRRSAFVVHDLKNLLLQLTLVVRNADRHRDNPQFQRDTLATVKNAQTRMQEMLAQLQSNQASTESNEAVDVERLIEAAISSKPAIAPLIRTEVDKQLGGVSIIANQLRLQRVIGNLIQNASEASGPNGEIRLSARRLGLETEIEVQDYGVGMSEQFVRTRLFRPFVTSKVHGTGIGVFESREYVRELGGTIEVASRENVGTVFKLRLPIRDQA